MEGIATSSSQPKVPARPAADSYQWHPHSTQLLTDLNLHPMLEIKAKDGCEAKVKQSEPQAAGGEGGWYHSHLLMFEGPLVFTGPWLSPAKAWHEPEGNGQK